MMWLQARFSWLATVMVALGVGACLLVASSTMPIMRVGLGKVPFSVLLPVLPAVGVLVLTVPPLPLEEARARRRGMFLIRSVWCLALLGACGAVLTLSGWVMGDAQMVVCARNVCGYFGLAAFVNLVGGRLLAYAVPAGYAVGVSILGTRGRGVWVWPLDLAHARGSAIIALCLGVVGVVLVSGTRVMMVEARRSSSVDQEV